MSALLGMSIVLRLCFTTACNIIELFYLQPISKLLSLCKLNFSAMYKSLQTKRILSVALLYLSCMDISVGMAAVPVVDAQLINETIQSRVESMQAWAKDNELQISQLQQLVNTQAFLEQQATMPYQSTWQSMQKLQENSLALAHATQAIWKEFGSAHNYYVNHLMATAWDGCIASGNCNFNQALSKLNNAALQQALQAAENANQVNTQLSTYISHLQQLSIQAQSSTSIASTLDTLTKITGNIDALLITLNAQSAALLQQQSQEATQQALERQSERRYLQMISQYSEQATINLPNQIP